MVLTSKLGETQQTQRLQGGQLNVRIGNAVHHQPLGLSLCECYPLSLLRCQDARRIPQPERLQRQGQLSVPKLERIQEQVGIK